MTDINTKQNKQELLAMVAEVLQTNSASRRRARTQLVRVSSGLKRKRTRTQREVVSSPRKYDSPKVRAIGFYPFDPSYLFCGVGSVSNYKKKRFGRLWNRVSLVA